MKLSGHQRKEWLADGFSADEILTPIDRIYADPTVTSQRFFDTGTVKRIHTSKRADLLVMHVCGRPVCVKYFHDRRLRVRLRTFLGLAKGRRGYFSGLRLAGKGIEVPQQLACIELRPFGPTVVVMELLESITTVAGWLSARDVQPDIPRALVEKLAVFTAALHRQGIFHCDFSPRNVMVQEYGSVLRFVLIDLEDVRFGRPADPKRCVQNLARFAREALPHVSKRTVIQFLRAYIHEMGSRRPAAGLMREIMRTL